MFLTTEAIPENLNRSAEKTRSATGLFLRVFIETASISFKDDILSPQFPNEIILRMSSTVFLSAFSSGTSPSISLSFAEVLILERIHESELLAENLLLTFSNQKPDESSLVISKHPFDADLITDATTLSGPHLEVTANMRPITEGGTEITISFQHAQCFLSLKTLNRWSSALGGLLVPQENTSSSIAFSCQIDFKSIDLIFQDSHVSRRESLPPLSLIQESKSRWKRIQNNQVKTESSSIRLVVHGLQISLGAHPSPSFSISIGRINSFLRLHYLVDSLTVETWELGYLSMRSGKREGKISLHKEKFTGPEGIVIEARDSESDGKLDGDTLDISKLDVTDVFVISAGNVQVGKSIGYIFVKNNIVYRTSAI